MSPDQAIRLTRSFSPNRVTIYVGNPHTLFVLRRSGLDASPLLSKMVAYQPDNGWYAMSPTLSQLDKDDFMPIGQYLERGEYDPNILDEGTEWVRLETNVSGQDAGEEVMRCAVIYDIARTLELPGLQDLAFRKLKAMAKNEPHKPFAILCVVDHVFKHAQPDMRKYLVEYLAEHFWNLVTLENKKIAEVMEADEELGKRVFGRLAGQPEAEVKNEAEGKIKDEKLFGEGKDEPGSPATLVGDEEEGGLIGKGTSQENTTPHHATVTTATDDDTTAEKKKAEKEKAKRMTAKELLTENDALVDQAATILSAANATVSFEPEDPAPTVGKIEEGGLSHEEQEMIKLAVGGMEEGLSQEEQDMIKMALRESDKEAAEKDLMESQQQANVAGASGIDDRKGWEMID